ncbi:hypothetical protein BSK56_02660 [Paenibacillus borealis]|uniref:Uncharacterized protein n=1 Tax=Paenibacillus borealis TaxID=160799 RepID=A0ABX3HRF2_PAEBO|nr:hypothetical protein BSK56_02660 [Paenibacillus borealis]
MPGLLIVAYDAAGGFFGLDVGRFGQSGHVHWDQPLAELDNGTQILNTDGRVLLFTAASLQ